MENFKFKKGDNVRVIKIDDTEFYGRANYEVGDIGTILTSSNTQELGNCYKIHFDRLEDTYHPMWWAKEDWLKPEKALIVCE